MSDDAAAPEEDANTEQSASDHDDGGERRRRDGGARKQPPSPARLARRASNELAELIGGEVEGVVGLQRTDDGWSIGVEVLELRRIPDTADVLAEYEVTTDKRGRLLGYQRLRRYARGSVREDR